VYFEDGKYGSARSASPARRLRTRSPSADPRYQVKLLGSKSATTPSATSSVHSVYVLANGWVTGGKTCGRPVCHETFHIYTVVPSSALGVELSKPNYPYLGINLTTGAGVPSPPRWLYLNAAHASTSGARKVSAGEFEIR
jgi:hypothetical protein